MRQLGIGICSAGVVGLLLAAGAAGAAEPTAGLPPTLRVLVAADEMPEMFSFAASGPPGLERELLEGFCRIHGLHLQVVRVSEFEQIIPMLRRGEGDVITGIVDTESRRRSVSFTSEVFPVRHLLVTRRPGAALSRDDDVKGLRVGVIPGTSWEEAALDAGVPKSRLTHYRDAPALLAGLREGDVDAVVMALLDFALAQKHDPQLVAGPFVGKASRAALAVRPEDARLLEALDGYLQGMSQARHALMFKYLSEEALSLIALARRD
jgi:ABC-type amino acid transport substrate-binding protein